MHSQSKESWFINVQMILWPIFLKPLSYLHPFLLHCFKINWCCLAMSPVFLEIIPSLKCKSIKLFCAAFCTHVHKNFWTHPSLCSLWYSGTLNRSSNWACFSTSIDPVTVSHFCSICWTHSCRAFSTSGHVTMQARLEDNTVGVATSLAWSCSCHVLVKCQESVPWVKRRASLWRNTWQFQLGRLACVYHTNPQHEASHEESNCFYVTVHLRMMSWECS